MIHGSHTDTKDAIERLAKDVEEQVAKRGKYSRRRMHDDDADIGKSDKSFIISICQIISKF